mgnify:CR=1 FL=1
MINKYIYITFIYIYTTTRRYSGGRRKLTGNTTTNSKQLNYKYDSRPSTAPIKRGMLGSRLKNNSTRPMAFED